MNSGKIALGALAGLAIGATVGILFAPDKGSTTRKKISMKRDEYVDELEDKFSDFVNSITRKFETVKKEAGNMAENVKQKAEETKKKVTTDAN
jgi:gas vesicle protein